MEVAPRLEEQASEVVVIRWQRRERPDEGALGTEDGGPGRKALRPSLQDSVEALAVAISGARGPRCPQTWVSFGVLFAPRGSSHPLHGSGLPVPATATSLPPAQLP